MDDIKITDTFSGENAEGLNVLLTTLIECGKDFAKLDNKVPNDNSLYVWLDKTPKDTLVMDIINKLDQLGYKIHKK